MSLSFDWMAFHVLVISTIVTGRVYKIVSYGISSFNISYVGEFLIWYFVIREFPCIGFSADGISLSGFSYSIFGWFFNFDRTLGWSSFFKTVRLSLTDTTVREVASCTWNIEQFNLTSTKIYCENFCRLRAMNTCPSYWKSYSRELPAAPGDTWILCLNMLVASTLWYLAVISSILYRRKLEFFLSTSKYRLTCNPAQLVPTLLTLAYSTKPLLRLM